MEGTDTLEALKNANTQTQGLVTDGYDQNKGT